MAIRLNCPKCDKLFFLPGDVAGTLVRCSHCKTTFTAPAERPPVEAATPEGAAPTAVEPPLPPRDAIKSVPPSPSPDGQTAPAEPILELTPAPPTDAITTTPRPRLSAAPSTAPRRCRVRTAVRAWASHPTAEPGRRRLPRPPPWSESWASSCWDYSRWPSAAASAVTSCCRAARRHRRFLRHATRTRRRSHRPRRRCRTPCPLPSLMRTRRHLARPNR